VCRDAPVRQCFAWHVVPRGRKVRHAKRADGTDDPFSVRMLCPAHSDREPSLSISVDDGRIKWQCLACGSDATAKVRLALIREYGIDPACLPLPAKDKGDILEQVAAIVTGDCDYAEKVLRVAAALEGYRELPRGGELERIAALAGVARRSAYRARKAAPGLQAANTRSYAPAENPVKRRRS
jgi:hypothetical protein